MTDTPALSDIENARIQAAARTWIGYRQNGTHPWDDEPIVDPIVDSFRKHTLVRMEKALAAADAVQAPLAAQLADALRQIDKATEGWSFGLVHTVIEKIRLISRAALAVFDAESPKVES